MVANCTAVRRLVAALLVGASILVTVDGCAGADGGGQQSVAEACAGMYTSLLDPIAMRKAGSVDWHVDISTALTNYRELKTSVDVALDSATNPKVKPVIQKADNALRGFIDVYSGLRADPTGRAASELRTADENLVTAVDAVREVCG